MAGDDGRPPGTRRTTMRREPQTAVRLSDRLVGQTAACASARACSIRSWVNHRPMARPATITTVPPTMNGAPSPNCAARRAFGRSGRSRAVGCARRDRRSPRRPQRRSATVARSRRRRRRLQSGLSSATRPGAAAQRAGGSPRFEIALAANSRQKGDITVSLDERQARRLCSGGANTTISRRSLPMSWKRCATPAGTKIVSPGRTSRVS